MSSSLKTMVLFALILGTSTCVSSMQNINLTEEKELQITSIAQENIKNQDDLKETPYQKLEKDIQSLKNKNKEANMLGKIFFTPFNWTLNFLFHAPKTIFLKTKNIFKFFAQEKKQALSSNVLSTPEKPADGITK